MMDMVKSVAKVLGPVAKEIGKKALKEVVGIAMRGCRVHISRRKFQSLGRSIESIRTAWRVAVPTVMGT